MQGGWKGAADTLLDLTHSDAIAKNKTGGIRFSGHDDTWTIEQLD
jgi:hypothetical protein